MQQAYVLPDVITYSAAIIRGTAACEEARQWHLALGLLVTMQTAQYCQLSSPFLLLVLAVSMGKYSAAHRCHGELQMACTTYQVAIEGSPSMLSFVLQRPAIHA